MRPLRSLLESSAKSLEVQSQFPDLEVCCYWSTFLFRSLQQTFVGEDCMGGGGGGGKGVRG